MSTSSKTYKIIILIVLVEVNLINMFVNITMQIGDDGIFMILFVGEISIVVGVFAFILCDILANLEDIKENTNRGQKKRLEYIL